VLGAFERHQLHALEIKVGEFLMSVLDALQGIREVAPQAVARLMTGLQECGDALAIGSGVGSQG
jgi:hypothetical protein